MNRQPAFLVRPLSAVALAVSLAACQAEPSSAPQGRAADAGADMGMAVPKRLLQSRAVDRMRLRPDVILSTGQRVSMRRIDDTTWSGTVRVDPGIQLGVEVVWVSEQPRGDLPLARLSRSVPIGPDGAALEVSEAQYDYAIDSDGDGVLNLDELEAGSDPFPEPPATGGGPDVPTPDPDASNPNAPPPDTGLPMPPTTGTQDPDPIDPTPDRPAIDPSDTTTPTPDGDGTGDETGDESGDVTPVDVDVFVPRIAATRSPRIDGRRVTLDADGLLTGEWTGAVQVDSGGRPLGIDALMIDRGAEAPSGTPWRSWGAVHDGEYLYVVVIVEDNGQRQGDSPLFWQDDGIELFLDGDHGRQSTYGDDDDYHLIVPLLEPGTAGEKKRPNANDVAGWLEGPFSSGQGIELDFVTGPGVGPDGLRRPRFERDVYELRIALDSIGVEPGQPFGFELQVNDDDDGGPRDSKWGWAHPPRADTDVDFTFVNPSFMGTLMLD